jgi:hypothetical protein
VFTMDRLVQKYVQKLLGQFIEELSPSQIEAKALGTNVRLSELRLRRGALTNLGIPFVVAEGTIGSVSALTPKKRWGSPLTKICVDDVFLVLSPSEELLGGKGVCVGSSATVFDGAMEAKLRVLAARECRLEAVRRLCNFWTGGKHAGARLVSSVVGNIFSNVEVSRDSSPCFLLPFSLLHRPHCCL